MFYSYEETPGNLSWTNECHNSSPHFLTVCFPTQLFAFPTHLFAIVQAKSLRVDLSKKTAVTKPDLIRALLQHGSKQTSILDFTRLKSNDAQQSPAPSTPKSSSILQFSSTPNSSTSTPKLSSTPSASSKLLLVKAKALLGTGYRVADEPREVFLRAILLFDMCGFWMDVLQDSGNTQGTLLLSNQSLTLLSVLPNSFVSLFCYYWEHNWIFG